MKLGMLQWKKCGEGQDRYYGFYRCGAEGPEFIEKVVRDPYTLYWGYAKAGEEGITVREEQAMEVLASYRYLNLEMRPVSQYGKS